MSQNIDELLIDIQTQSKDVDNKLESLASSLYSMANAVSTIDTTTFDRLANGLARISSSVKGLASTSSRSFESAITKIGSLSNLNTTAIAETATTLSTFAESFNSASKSVESITNLAQAVGTLGSVKVERALTNISQLGYAVKGMLQNLSDAPALNASVIASIKALSDLASQGQKVNTVYNGLARASVNLKKATSKATQGFLLSSKGFDVMIQTFYRFRAILNSVKNALSGVMSYGESAMDYVETFNFFSVSLDKVSKETEKQYAKQGGLDAESYYNAFTKKIAELNRKMTGFTLGNNGELLGDINIGLGVDPELLMNFQAKILSVTTSVGMLGSTSVNTAKALSMLSNDISSLTNQDVESVMTNLQSGLIGQSRALYKYGIDITNATLAQYALANGISKSVSKMSQSEKMQLRVLAILDKSRVAWGDQANTINSVANQYRILKQQVSNLGRTLGNLLLPIIQKVLPYVNAFVIVLRRLFEILGFKLYGGDWLSGLQDGISGGVGDLGDDVDSLGESLDDASGSAKKLKTNLLGIDELNVLNQDDNSGKGIGGLGGGFNLDGAISDALAEYERVWNEAFENARNKASEIAEKLLGIFDKIANSKFGKALRDLWETLKEVGSFSFDTLADFWNKFLKPVASWVGNDVFARLVKLFKEFVNDIDWATLKSALANIYETLSKFVIGIGKGLLAVFEPLAKIGLKVLAGAINVVAKALDGLFKVLKKIPEPVLVAIGGAIGAFLTVFATKKYVIPIIAKFSETLITFGVSAYKAFSNYPHLMLKELASGIMSLINPTNVIIALTGAFVALGVELRNQAKNSAIESLYNALSTEKLEEFSRHGIQSFTSLSDGVSEKCAEIESRFTALKENLNTVSETHTSLEGTVSDINNLKTAIELGAYTADEKVGEIIESFNNLQSQTNTIFQAEYDSIMSGLAGAIGDAYVAMGGDLNSLVESFALVKAQGDESLASIYTQMSTLEAEFNNGKIGADEYASKMFDLYGQLSTFTGSGVADKTAEGINNIKGALDLSDFSTDGMLDASKFTSYFSEISNQVSSGVTDIEQAGTDYGNALTSIKTQLESLGVDLKGVDIEGALNANTTAVLTNKDDYLSAWEEYTNQIQIGLVEQLPSIIEEATSGYEELNPISKLFVSKEMYVNDAINEWQNNTVVPITNEIQTSFENMGIEGETWADEASKRIFNGLLIDNREGIPELASNWSEMLNGMLTDVETMVDMDTFASNTIAGYANAMADSGNQAQSQFAIQSWAENIEKWFHDSNLKFGSPSKTMYDYGVDTVTGYDNGISESFKDTKNVINNFTTNVLMAFKAKSQEFFYTGQYLGNNVAQGLLNGLNSRTGEILGWANSVASQIASAFSSAMQIHSPSRVMYKLGAYVTEGLQLGMESMYGTTLDSFRGFTSNIANVPNQSFTIDSNMSYNDRYASFEDTVSNRTNETVTSMLLPYLSQIATNTRESAQKELQVNIGDRQIARANARGTALLGRQLITI